MKIPESVQSWVAMLTNLGVLAGLFLLVVEINQNSRQLELQLQFQANQKLSDTNSDLLDPHAASIYAKAITSPSELTFDEGLTASALLLNMLMAWEDKYWIYEAGLITDQKWKQEVRDSLPWVLGSPFAKQVWNTTKAEFEDEFSDFIDGELENLPDDVTWQWWLDFQSGLPEPAGQQ